MTEQIDGQAIEVNPSSLPEQAWSGVQTIAPAVVAFLYGRHLLPDDVIVLLGVIGSVVWAVVANWLKTRVRANQLIALAKHPKVPSNLCRIKR